MGSWYINHFGDVFPSRGDQDALIRRANAAVATRLDATRRSLRSDTEARRLVDGGHREHDGKDGEAGAV